MWLCLRSAGSHATASALPAQPDIPASPAAEQQSLVWVYIFIVGMTLLKAVQFEMIQAHGVDSSAPRQMFIAIFK